MSEQSQKGQHSQHSQRRKKAARRRQRGFSLIEIMVALTIVSMVMGAAGFAAYRQLQKARVSQTRNMMHEIEGAVTQYAADTGDTCPPTMNALVEKKIMKKEPKDGYGEGFLFKCPGEHNNDIDLISKGADKKEGTEDDIRSWEEEKK